jgi:hypothetical protein
VDEDEEEEEEEEEEEAAEELPVPKPQRDIRHRPDATRILTTEDFQLIGDSTSLIPSSLTIKRVTCASQPNKNGCFCFLNQFSWCQLFLSRHPFSRRSPCCSFLSPFRPCKYILFLLHPEHPSSYCLCVLASERLRDAQAERARNPKNRTNT